MTEKLDAVFCHRCGLKQWRRPTCLKCGVNLRQPDLIDQIAALRAELHKHFEDRGAPMDCDHLIQLAAAPLLPTLKEAERALILEALKRTHGNKKAGAQLIGISNTTMFRKCKEIGA